MKTRNTFGAVEGKITIRSKMRAIERIQFVSPKQRKKPLRVLLLSAISITAATGSSSFTTN